MLGVYITMALCSVDFFFDTFPITLNCLFVYVLERGIAVSISLHYSRELLRLGS